MRWAAIGGYPFQTGICFPVKPEHPCVLLIVINACTYEWWGVVSGWTTSQTPTLAQERLVYLAYVVGDGAGAKRPKAELGSCAPKHQISGSPCCVTRFFSKLDQNNDMNVKNKKKEKKLRGLIHRFVARKAFIFLQCQISVWRSELRLSGVPKSDS